MRMHGLQTPATIHIHDIPRTHYFICNMQNTYQIMSNYNDNGKMTVDNAHYRDYQQVNNAQEHTSFSTIVCFLIS